MEKEIFIGNNKITDRPAEITGNYVKISGEDYYCIQNYDLMPPFFMSIVSSSDHWFFISSTGGLSMGRQNAESAIFPYYTEDKISENLKNTGALSIILASRGRNTHLWEPFQPYENQHYQISRNIYKNIPGNILIFEEINNSLLLSFSVKWQTSEKYGFVKTTSISNLSEDNVSINVLDGVQNILPYGTTTTIQTTFSNLLNAYKHNELDTETGIGIFALNSSLSDLAEPSESLKATIAWQIGLENPVYLLSSKQLENFKSGKSLLQEINIRGQRGAYFVNSEFSISGYTAKEWNIVTEVNQDASAILSLKQYLLSQFQAANEDIKKDIQFSTSELIRIISGADGLQLSRNKMVSAHHFSNVLFNVMRGGTFFDDYSITKSDFLKFINSKNKNIISNNEIFISKLPEIFNYTELKEKVLTTNVSCDFEKASLEYLPLAFSRRHGDPSRPWNKFSINVKNTDGSRRLDYEGNWRDIFQNWEALSLSFPEYIEGMVFKFLNATTIDGYNPYRITRDSIDWEIPEPGNPWANIGYWGDHQIIYLLKLLELSHKYHPGMIEQLLSKEIFCYAHVPYKIKDYEKMLDDPFHTIEFDWDLNEAINNRVKLLGSDGKLFVNKNGEIFHATLFEKILSLLLAKITNFVPGGGIWLNTQRPEWNDANNALVGKGLSVVTTGYLLRFIKFFSDILKNDTSKYYTVSLEFYNYYIKINQTISAYPTFLIPNMPISPELRKRFMDELGASASLFRNCYYSGEFSIKNHDIDKKEFLVFLDLLSKIIETTLHVNKRSDNLYHSYNTIKFSSTTASVEFLTEMLEGQVSILSSGLLSVDETLVLLNNLRKSNLYREDQNTYILYPDRNIPGFLKKNSFTENTASRSKLLLELGKEKDNSIVNRDIFNHFHFNGNFRNINNLKNALEELKRLKPKYSSLIQEEQNTIYDIFEEVFDHRSFTGRSGSFFAYEGLGSIYWHMVAKLLLAVQDKLFEAMENGTVPSKTAALSEYYDEIRAGLGFTKKPAEFGAFPSDPYSHTPAGQGAKQPGMTGQVKEEILTRLKELGISITDGKIGFVKNLFQKEELSVNNSEFQYFNINKEKITISVDAGQTIFTICQVPFVISQSQVDTIIIYYDDGTSGKVTGHIIPESDSKNIFRRNNKIIKVKINSCFAN